METTVFDYDLEIRGSKKLDGVLYAVGHEDRYNRWGGIDRTLVVKLTKTGDANVEFTWMRYDINDGESRVDSYGNFAFSVKYRGIVWNSTTADLAVWLQRQVAKYGRQCGYTGYDGWAVKYDQDPYVLIAMLEAWGAKRGVFDDRLYQHVPLNEVEQRDFYRVSGMDLIAADDINAARAAAMLKWVDMAASSEYATESMNDWIASGCPCERVSGDVPLVETLDDILAAKVRA